MSTKIITYEEYKKLYDALVEAHNHLEYCGYGDSWERECAREDKLDEQLVKAITEAEKILEGE